MKSLSPIILFTYLRFNKLKKTINYLQENYLASESDLIIFSDAAKIQQDQIFVLQIRNYLKTVKGFKSIKIIESTFHKGLAQSVIEGVSEVIANKGKAIILEDDIITTKNFLNFMNQSLDTYFEKKEIISISGYKHNYKCKSNSDVFLFNRAWSWGWATWQDRWEEIDWNVRSYSTFNSDHKLRNEFAQLGSDVNKMLWKQMQGYLDSWVIKFLFHQFKTGTLTLYPTISKVQNDGWDEVATNTKGLSDRYLTDFDLSEKKEFLMPDHLKIDKLFQEEFISNFSVRSRIVNKIKELFQF